VALHQDLKYGLILDQPSCVLCVEAYPPSKKSLAGECIALFPGYLCWNLGMKLWGVCNVELTGNNDLTCTY